MDHSDSALPPSTPAVAGPAFAFIEARWTVCIGADEVSLTPTQFRLLQIMAIQPGQQFSRQDLIDRVIGRRVTERTIDVHIKELRRKLGRHGHWIQTVRGQGYAVVSDGQSPHL